MYSIYWRNIDIDFARSVPEMPERLYFLMFLNNFTRLNEDFLPFAGVPCVFRVCVPFFDLVSF